jgi:hypothetical protein
MPGANCGADTTLSAGYLYSSADSECDIYLFFDVSSVIASTATVVSAELKLYVSDSFNTSGISLSIEDADDTWGEDDVTWNNAPTTTPVTQFVAPPDGFVGWFTVTSPQLTALVQSWVSNSSPNNGLAILPASGTQYGWSITVDSSENSSGNSPTLVVHYNQGATQYKLTTTVSPAGSGTIARSPDATWYDPGAVVQLTATPNIGYVFDHWSDDLSGTTNPENLTMDGPKSVTANFAPSWSEMEEVDADADAWVWEDYPADNYGDDVDLYAGYSSISGGQENVYLHFDLSSLPSTTTVVVVELWVYISFSWNHYDTGYSLAAVDEPWDEDTITWDDAPASTQMFTFTGPADEFEGWYKITDPDLIAKVQDWISNPSANNGLAIAPLPSTTSDDEVYMNSREAANAPKLIVYYNPSGYRLTATADPAAGGTVDTLPTSPDRYYNSGTVVTLTAIPNVGYEFVDWSGDLSGTENPTTVTMDSDKTVTANFIPLWSAAAEGDAWVWEDDPTYNCGDDVDLYAGYPSIGGGQENIYLHFDLSSLPGTTTVVAVELWLYFSQTFNSYGTGYSLAAVDGAWDESLITWDDAPASTPVCTFAGPEDGFIGWYKITDPDLIAKVQDWISNPSANNGLAIAPLPSTTSDDEIYADSRENSSGNAPKLVIRYNP